MFKKTIGDYSKLSQEKLLSLWMKGDKFIAGDPGADVRYYCSKLDDNFALIFDPFYSSRICIMSIPDIIETYCYIYSVLDPVPRLFERRKTNGTYVAVIVDKELNLSMDISFNQSFIDIPKHAQIEKVSRLLSLL